jgi:hypothetical protein
LVRSLEFMVISVCKTILTSRKTSMKLQILIECVLKILKYKSEV